jgi:hypothetical protein
MIQLVEEVLEDAEPSTGVFFMREGPIGIPVISEPYLKDGKNRPGY